MEENKNGAGGSGGGGADLFNALLNNPELISKISNLMSALNKPGTESTPGTGGASQPGGGMEPSDNHAEGNVTRENNTVQPENVSGTGSEGASSDVSSKLSSLLSNKEFMSKLPDMLSMLKPLGGASQPAKSGGDAAPTMALVPGGGGHHHGHNIGRRNALMIALKPYLSPRRREAIEYIIRMDKLGDIFRTLS